MHSNESCCCCWISLGERGCFRRQRGLARPECAGLSSPPDMVARDSSPLRHKDPLHIPLYPVHCEGAGLEALGSRGCFRTKCISCQWPVSVPVQLLEALRCSGLSVNIRGRRQGSHHRSCTSHQRREPQLFGGSQILHSFPRKTVRLPVKRLARHSSFHFRSANYS